MDRTEMRPATPGARFFRLTALAAAGSVAAVLVAQLALTGYRVPKEGVGLQGPSFDWLKESSSSGSLLSRRVEYQAW